MIIVGKELNFSGILFLDVDGVLNSEKWFRSSEYREKRLGFEAKYKTVQHGNDLALSAYSSIQIDPEAVENLNRILITLNPAIVLSSTWRHGEWGITALAQSEISGWKERFLGITPCRNYIEDQTRGWEIHAWLTTASYTGPTLIIDDDVDFEVEYSGISLMHSLLQTNGRTGLTSTDVCKVTKPAPFF